MWHLPLWVWLSLLLGAIMTFIVHIYDGGKLVENNKVKKFLGSVGGFIGKHKVIVIILVVAIVGGSIYAAYSKSQKDKPPVMSEDYWTTVEKMDLTKSVSVTGSIAAADSVSVSSNLAGKKVKKVNFEVGDYVEKGQVIVELDADDLADKLTETLAKTELSDTKSEHNVSVAQRDLDKALKDYQDAVNTQNKAVSDAAYEYYNAIATQVQAEQAYNEAVAKYNNVNNFASAFNNAHAAAYSKAKAVTDYKSKTGNYAKIYEDNTNNNVMDSLNAAMAAAGSATVADSDLTQAQLDAIISAVNGLKNNQIVTSSSLSSTLTSYGDSVTSTAQRLYQAGNATNSAAFKLQQAKNTQATTNSNNLTNISEKQFNLDTTTDQTAIDKMTNAHSVESAYEQLDTATLTAPISGYITEINVREGQIYTSGNAFTVMDMSGYKVEGTVDQYDISSLVKGMDCEVKTDATGDEILKGKLTYVALVPNAPASSAASGLATATSGSSTSTNYDIKVTLDKASEKLRVGMTAQTSIVIDSVKDVLAVPYDCVGMEEDGSYFVYIINDDMTETKTPVNVSLDTGYYMAITGNGISEGVKVRASASSSSSGPDDIFRVMMGE